jgi:hypothetical protein
MLTGPTRQTGFFNAAPLARMEPEWNELAVWSNPEKSAGARIAEASRMEASYNKRDLDAIDSIRKG